MRLDELGADALVLVRVTKLQDGRACHDAVEVLVELRKRLGSLHARPCWRERAAVMLCFAVRRPLVRVLRHRGGRLPLISRPAADRGGSVPARVGEREVPDVRPVPRQSHAGEMEERPGRLALPSVSERTRDPVSRGARDRPAYVVPSAERVADVHVLPLEATVVVLQPGHEELKVGVICQDEIVEQVARLVVEVRNFPARRDIGAVHWPPHSQAVIPPVEVGVVLQELLEDVEGGEELLVKDVDDAEHECLEGVRG
eukprot:745721-Hanusia_phi.AAC.4